MQHPQVSQELFRAHSVLREFLSSAQATERGQNPKRNFRIGRPEASPLCASSLVAHSAGRARWVKKTVVARCVVRDVSEHQSATIAMHGGNQDHSQQQRIASDRRRLQYARP